MVCLQVVVFMQLNERAAAAGLWATPEGPGLSAVACFGELCTTTLFALPAQQGELHCANAALDPVGPWLLTHATKAGACVQEPNRARSPDHNPSC